MTCAVYKQLADITTKLESYGLAARYRFGIENILLEVYLDNLCVCKYTFPITSLDCKTEQTNTIVNKIMQLVEELI